MRGADPPEPGAIELEFHAAVVSVRDYEAAQHLWTARREAWLCRKLEDQLLTDNIDFDRRHRSHVTNAVLSATAFLEGVVNSTWQDAYDGKKSPHTIGIADQALAEIAGSWEGNENYSRKGLLDRFKRALKLAKRKPMPGDVTHESIKTLVEIRDYVVHCKPQSRQVNVDDDLQRRLKPKIKENKLPIGSPWFPNKALGAGAAEWAYESSTDFARGWHTRLGLVADFDKLYIESTGPFEIE